MKKLATIILATCLSAAFMLAAGLMASPAPVAPATSSYVAFAAGEIDALKNMEFDVTKHLKLGQPCTEKTAENVCGKGISCTNGYCDVQNQSYFGKEAGDERTYYPVFRFIVDIIETLTKIAGTIAVIMLILTGFLMMFSQGNQNTLEKAKQMFLYEILGMAAILLSYLMVTLVQSIFAL
ncbi:MAG: hypothetical protein WC604_03955 [Candidatus Gracilibacteria bacterium]